MCKKMVAFKKKRKRLSNLVTGFLKVIYTNKVTYLKWKRAQCQCTHVQEYIDECGECCMNRVGKSIFGFNFLDHNKSWTMKLRGPMECTKIREETDKVGPTFCVETETEIRDRLMNFVVISARKECSMLAHRRKNNSNKVGQKVQTLMWSGTSQSACKDSINRNKVLREYVLDNYCCQQYTCS